MILATQDADILSRIPTRTTRTKDTLYPEGLEMTSRGVRERMLAEREGVERMLLQEGGGVEGGNRRDSRGMMEVLVDLLRREGSVGGDIPMGVLGAGESDDMFSGVPERT